MRVILVKAESLFFLLILYSYVMLKFYESFILCKITIAQAVARTSSADFFSSHFSLLYQIIIEPLILRSGPQLSHSNVQPNILLCFTISKWTGL